MYVYENKQGGIKLEIFLMKYSQDKFSDIFTLELEYNIEN